MCADWNPIRLRRSLKFAEWWPISRLENGNGELGGEKLRENLWRELDGETRWRNSIENLWETVEETR